MARRRAPGSSAETPLPAHLLTGPTDLERWAPAWTHGCADPATARRHLAAMAWRHACTTWSRANGHGWNGWTQLLPADLAEQIHTRRRLIVAGD